MTASLISLGLKYQDRKLWILDQQKLPSTEEWVECQSPDQMIAMIRALKVRGAPLIGVAAALALADYAVKGAPRAEILSAAQKLREARPTAVNLMAAMDRMLSEARDSSFSAEALLQTAQDIFREDVILCEKMAQNGASLIEDGDSILTHCNTGGLATVGVGTALGVIRKAHEQGKKIHVYVDETRPLLQGGRLTTWELKKLGIQHTLICDNMAATLMRKKKIQKVFLGSDRIALNGDFANKVGTYNVAVIAHYHRIPFYPVAPYTTIDFECASGDQIPIEERSAEEVQMISKSTSAVYNPSFDVTLVDLVTGLVLDSAYYSQKELKAGALKGLKKEKSGLAP